MIAILIRNVPDSVAAALRERARRRGRSMQQELLRILEEAAAEAMPGEHAPPIRLRTVRTDRTTTWPREEIYGDHDR